MGMRTTRAMDVRVANCATDAGARRAALAHAAIALYRDGSCRRRNVQLSCFAAERCDRSRGADGVGGSHGVASMREQDTCYVALTVPDDALCGFVAVTSQGLLHSFCVAHQHRAKRIGSRLLARAIADAPHALSLTVALPTGPRGAAASDVLRARSARLLRFYESFGFRVSGPPRDGYLPMRKSVAFVGSTSAGPAARGGGPRQ